ncbi:TPA: hypothetical protein NGR42_004831 [Vibrio parahaemolyticus]|uniref:hypothetical protein n=1 Tax=Vibrio diabolicus subgroup TaxID=2315253 RepID=UPI0010E4A539|nr:MULTISPECIES: hypothetical protein [Vibrio diabolicus subgroup]TBT23429.1 hypothetical protein D5E80_25665 [Vibrio parahaemolyticus]MCE9846315.1 hypothetical protein [Vibrio antiquarius]MCS0305614.1 hypothetical protein [Vibrio diabolicus]HCE3021313.1 hypothetical protein [Vibrio parahaemolyticus]HCE4480315.1 hypothetical protein [Vibrio parahaemolyticus]
MEDVIQAIQKQIENTEVGKDVVISFGGIATIIDVEMTFVGGWVIKQEIIPGKKLVFTKGNGNSLIDLTITFRSYEGLS